jgi:hypothetical protein
MKQNTYINYLVKELNSHLNRAADFERESYQKQAQNIDPAKQEVNYKSVYLRDLFDFYLKDLEFTPQQFINAVNYDRTVIENLYSFYTSYISDRRDLQDIFADTIASNPNLFLLALKQCLDNHQYPYETAIKHPDNKEVAAQIQRNTEDFQKLLQIGEVHNLFRKLPKDAFYTKNTLYKNIMQEKGLLENEAFDEKKLITLIEAGTSGRRHRELDKVAEYCIFYIKDMVEKFDSPGTFNAWAASHVNNKQDSEGRILEVVSDMDFFNWITKEVNTEIKVYQDKFIDQWTDSLTFRERLSRGYSSDLAFLKSHPHKIVDFLSKFTSAEKNGLMEKGLRELDFSKSYHDFRSFLTNIPLENSSPIYHAKIIETVIDFKKAKIHSDDVMADNAFFSAALNYLVAESLKVIPRFSLSDEEKAQAKIDVLSVYAKNQDIIASLIYDLPNAITANIYNLESNWKELRLHSRELNLTSDFFSELESRAGFKLEQYCLKKLDPSRYNVMKNTVECVQNSMYVVSALGLYSTLDKLNIVNLKLDKEVKVSSKKTKYLDGYPAVFEIIDTTTDKGILSWIFQEKHIPLLKEQALYKNRNVIEYFSMLETDNKVQESVVEKIFEVIMENKPVFKELILSKKKFMKAVQGLNNEYIQTSLDFVALDNSLKKNEEPVKRASNKL